MNSTVIVAAVTGFIGIVGTLIAAWVKRIEGKDKVFRTSVRQDMRVMFALKNDYGQLHTWAVTVRTEWHELQAKLRATGAINEIRDLPAIPEPTFEKIEDEAA